MGGEGGIPALLEVQVSDLGQGLPGLLVPPGHAQQPEANEESRPHATPHEELLMNWFWVKGAISNGADEGLNNKIRAVIRRSYSSRTYDAMEIALYHTLGRLPEPESTYKFGNSGFVVGGAL